MRLHTCTFTHTYGYSLAHARGLVPTPRRPFIPLPPHPPPAAVWVSQEGPPAGPTLGCPQCGQRFFQAECPECHAPNYYAGERRPQDAATPATGLPPLLAALPRGPNPEHSP